jgi:hypothetical protein
LAAKKTEFFSGVLFACLQRLITVSLISKNSAMSRGAHGGGSSHAPPKNSPAPDAFGPLKAWVAIADTCRQSPTSCAAASSGDYPSRLLGVGAGKSWGRALAVRKRLRFTG